MESGRSVSVMYFSPGEWSRSSLLSVETPAVGGHIPPTGPHCGSASRMADNCRVRFKKEVRSFSKVRKEMEKFTSRESAEC